jgi:hypothetical protein
MPTIELLFSVIQQAGHPTKVGLSTSLSSALIIGDEYLRLPNSDSSNFLYLPSIRGSDMSTLMI